MGIGGTIAVRGASEGELAKVNLDIPLGELVCFTGRPGSGSRTMAIDVLYAESRRRYMLALAPWERQQLGGMGSVDVESITGLPPAMYLDRQDAKRGEDLASFLQVDGMLGQLIQQCGQINCLNCGSVCLAYKPEEAAAAAIDRFAGERILLLAPLERSESIGFQAIASELKRAGFTRVRVQGEVGQIDKFEGNISGPIEVVVDRVAAEETYRTRIVEAVRTARSIAAGASLLVGTESGRVERLNRQLTCVRCEAQYSDLSADDLASIGADDQSLAAHATLCGRRAVELRTMPIADLLNFLGGLDIGGEYVDGLVEKLTEVQRLGLNYVELQRSLGDLSSGEQRRLVLAHALANGLVGILYIFDAPLADLGPKEARVYIDGLRRLTGQGNTVVVLDHHRILGEAAEVVCEFTRKGIPQGAESNRAANIRQRKTGQIEETLHIKIDGDAFFAAAELEIPLHHLVGLKGVSGSGKSRLLKGIAAALRGAVTKKEERTIRSKIKGGRDLGRLIEVEAMVKGKTLLTELGLAEHVAQLYAETAAAKKRGYSREMFSLSKPGGRCPTCEGQGGLQYDMQFLEDMSVSCPSCEGRRYRSEVLEITLRGMNIGDILDMSCINARNHFARQSNIAQRLDAALLCGLDSRRLGVDCSHLEPIEGLYLRLAIELARVRDRDILLLDHPAAGAHPADVEILVGVLDELVDKGASVLFAEHDQRVLEAADWMIKLGPGAGPHGGQILSSRARDHAVSRESGKSA